MKNSPWYFIQNIDQIDSPALVVFPERIQKNIDRMKEIVGKTSRLRPHIKTHKMAEVIAMQIQNGIQKFKCATIAEAELLGRTGAVNVLLAYQPVGPKIKRLADLIKKFPNTNFACLVDNLDAANSIAEVFSKTTKHLEVWIDLDVGQHRTGILADQNALDLFSFCKKTDGIIPVGFHVYDGHIRDSEFPLREKRSNEVFQQVQKLVVQIEGLYQESPQVVAGGSPTFTVHALRDDVDCSPGTCLLWDYRYHNNYTEQQFNYAALVVCRIISKPSNRFLCVDLGHKSIAAEMPFPRVHFLNSDKSSGSFQNSFLLWGCLYHQRQPPFRCPHPGWR